MERSGVLPTTQFAYRKGVGTCDLLLCVSHTLQSALESGQEARIVQIDFSAAFDRVNQNVLSKVVKPILQTDEEKELVRRRREAERKLVVKNFYETWVKNAF